MSSTPWYTLTVEQVAEKLKTSLQQGLSREEAERRFAQYGPNELEQTGRKTFLRMFIEQFADFMVIILIIAAIISALLGEFKDAVIIMMIVLLNGLLGAIQENKAEESLAALKKMAVPQAKVLREGRIDVVPAARLVPGDIVVLETGDFVPADIRFSEVTNLKIEEAALTGESVPVEKNSQTLDNTEIPLGDRLNIAHTSSLVTYGRGRGIVVETGMATQIGKIAAMIQSEEGTKTPLQKRMEVLGKTLGIAALAVCAVIFIVGVLYGKELFEMFLTAVSLAVAAIPEGLPAIVTIVLAIGVQRMSRRNAIIRKLPSVETLGSATVICSDKTGTLTQNKMSVEKVYFGGRLLDASELKEAGGEAWKLLVCAGTLCNDSYIRVEDGKATVIGDPTENALVELGMRVDLYKDALEQELPRVDEVPFDSARKLMTTVHRHGQGFRVYTKGAPDVLLKACSRILVDGEPQELIGELREALDQANDRMAEAALRVLGMAYKDLPPDTDLRQVKNELETDLIFIGLCGMIDPPRPEAREAVKLCRKAGIKPVMITGDHAATAMAIARDLGILREGDTVLTGRELDQMDDEELKEVVRSCSVYARVSPEHKVRIVKAWQSWQEIVAMTGDGVNDAPALKRADIGAAMGIVGTEVAKEASDMVLTDDNFATIVAAVEEGRVIFSNIIKSIQFLLSCNVGEILVLFIATILNWASPLLPIHILWVNLVTDSLPALALGVDPAETGIMERKPRDPKSRIFSKGMVRRIVYQGIMVGGLTLAAFRCGYHADLVTAQTMAFAVLALSQLVHSFNVRSNRRSIFRIGFFSNPQLVGAICISALLQISVITVPFLAGIFDVVTLSASQWLIVLLLSLAPLFIVEMVKLLGLNTSADED